MTHASDLDADVERLLTPLIEVWNATSPEELRQMRRRPLPCDPTLQISYVEETQTPFGYEWVEFEFRSGMSFTLKILIEGSPGSLSMGMCLPVVEITGDEAAARAWLRSI